MIKYIYGLADLHIRRIKYHKEYKDVFINLLGELKKISEGRDRSEQRIVIAGDIFHSKLEISNEQIVLCAWLLTELEKIADIIIISGNHDTITSNKDRLDSISPIIQLLGDKRISYLKESKCYLDDNVVWCSYSVFNDNERPNIELAKIEFGKDKKYVGLFHGAINGLKTDIGYEIEHGYNSDLFKGLDFCICGDIHIFGGICVKDGDNTIPVIMSSSCLQQNFGEKINNHGFVEWTVETAVYKLHEVENPYLFYNFKINNIEDIDNNNELLTNG